MTSANLIEKSQIWTDERSEGNPQQLINVVEILGRLWLGRWVICSVVVVFIAAAILYISLTPVTYKSNATILIDPRQERVTDANAVLSGFGSDSAAVASQVEVIRSRSLLLQVFTALSLEKDPEFAKRGLSSKIKSMVTGTQQPISVNSRFDAFRKKLAVNRQGLTYVIELAFSSQQPQKAAQILNAVTERYIQSQVSEKLDANNTVTRQLEPRIERLQKGLAAAETAVEEFKTRHDMLTLTDGGSLLQVQLSQLSGQLAVAQQAAREAVSQFNQAASIGLNAEALAQARVLLTSTSMDQLRIRYQQSKIRLSSLKAVYGPRHPSLSVANGEMAQTKLLVAEEGKRIIQQLAAARDIAQINVDSTQSELAKLRVQSDISNGSDVELRQLERQAAASRQVLETFLRRSRETGEMDGLQVSNARVISVAVAPSKAVWPRPSLIYLLAALLGLALGSAVALVLGGYKTNRPGIRRGKMSEGYASSASQQSTEVALPLPKTAYAMRRTIQPGRRK